MVAAVFSVQQIIEQRNWAKRDSTFKGNMKSIRLNAMGGGNASVPADLKELVQQFWNATPSGTIELNTVNPDAAAYFDIDGIYRVTFEKIGQLE